MNRGLRVLGFRMFIPPRDSYILDVGCGTGIHLEMYRKFGCRLYGIDSSSSMLELAKARLGDSADFRLGDASHMPYESSFFDLILCMLSLHEMEQQMRNKVLAEARRVLKSNGHILLIDFHAGRPRPIKGWLSKLVILLSEVAAGRRHFRNYRHFISIGGLPAVIAGNNLAIEKEKIVGDDTMALYLLRAS
jgi:ubiquinone/menaquinone biosynthesis C-methylase UbiE